VTHLGCGGKYDINLVATILLSPTVKELLKSAQISQTYERIGNRPKEWDGFYGSRCISAFWLYNIFKRLTLR